MSDFVTIGQTLGELLTSVKTAARRDRWEGFAYYSTTRKRHECRYTACHHWHSPSAGSYSGGDIYYYWKKHYEERHG